MEVTWHEHARSRFIVAVAILLTVAWLSAAMGVFGVDFPGDRPTDAHVPGRALVRFKPGVSRAAQQQALDSGGLAATVVHEIRALHVLIVEVPEEHLEAALRTYRANSQVAYAELDTQVTIALVSNDPLYAAQQYGPQLIRADRAWDTAQGAGVVIAVVDTGVDFAHPDLQGQLLSGGYDFANNDGDPSDDHGHGTHVSGIAAAATNNGVGIASIAPLAKILPVKVMSSSGSGAASALAEGIVYAADHNAKVINLSLGCTGYSQTVQDAVDYAWSHGAVVVAAAGNSNSSLPFYPAWYTHVIAVASVDSYSARSGFSNFGDRIAVAAPGTGILSTYWTAAAGSTYVAMSGTSMAAPHVAGLAALLFSQTPNRSNADVRLLIERSADDLGTVGWDHFYGSGRINAYRALSGILNPEPTSGPSPTAWPTQTPTPMPTPLPQTPELTPAPGLGGVGDLVWHDSNGNGAKETWEPGLPGVLIQLWKPGPNGLPGDGDDQLAATTVTGESGRYNFNPPAGNYYLAFQAPAGYVFSPQGYLQPPSQQWSYDTTETDSDVDPAKGRTGLVAVDPAGYNGTMDAGLHRIASVGGRVWLDENRDGLRQPGEAFVATTAVHLIDSGGRVIDTTITDADGRYLFTVARVPETLRVQVELPAPEYGCTAPHQDADDTEDSDVDPATGSTSDITLSAGDQRLHEDAGLTLGAGLQVACGVAPSGENPWNGTVTLTKFGSALGTLTGVRLTAHQWVRRAVYYENLAAAPGSYCFSGTNSATVTGPNGSTLTTSVPIGWSSGLWEWDSQPNFVGPSGLISEVRSFSGQSATYARPTDFLASTVGETIGLAVKGERTISFSASGPYNSQLRSSSGAIVCVTYLYVPPCREPVAPIVSIHTVAGTSDAQLSWSADAANERYEVHRAVGPLFEAGPSTLQTRLPAGATSYRDVGALRNETGGRLFYLVRAVNCIDPRRADSNRVGAFAFQLETGQP